MLFFEKYALVSDVIHLKRSDDPDHAGLLKVPVKATLMQVVTYMDDHKVGVTFVTDEDEIKGIISERDVICAIARYGLAAFNRSINTLMTQDIFTCKMTDSLKDITAEMARRRIRHAAVKDEEGQIIGVISSSDVELFAGFG